VAEDENVRHLTPLGDAAQRLNLTIPALASFFVDTAIQNLLSHRSFDPYPNMYETSAMITKWRRPRDGGFIDLA
jgi:hypothetical protein